ncbi:MAG: DUF6465 family protein [Clostridia bacterium]|nr:DUF6465 family protein [Clostridia bacterium]MDY5555489.1 DUF6465 family protein [Blautia sp.]
MERKKRNSSKPAATVKQTAEKVTAPVAAEVKEPAKKVVKETVKAVETKKTVNTTIEMDGLSVTLPAIEEAVKKAVEEKKIEGKEIGIYINTVQKAAYYTVDGQGSVDYKIDLSTL